MLIRKYENTTINTIITKTLLVSLLVFAFVIPINPELSKKVAIFSFIILLFFWDYSRIYKLIKENLHIKLVLLFIFMIILSYFWTDNFQELKRIFRTFIRYWIIPLFFLVSVINKENIKYLIPFFLFGMVVNLFLSISMYFYGLKEFFSIGTSRFYLVPFQTSHMEYSVYLALTTLLLFYYSIKLKHKYYKVLFLIFSILFLILLFVTMGRTGQVAFIFSSVLIIMIYFKNNILKLFSFGLILVLLLSFFSNFSNNFQKRYLQGSNDIHNMIMHKNYSSSLGVRLSAYLKIPYLLEPSNILFGVGYGDSQNEVHKINRKLFNKTQDNQLGRLHQSFLTVYHSMGITGVSVFILMIYYLLTVPITNKNIDFVRYVFIFCLFISLMTMDFQNQREILLLFAFFSSIIIVSSTKQGKL